jgi:hypothetical protein
MATLVRTPVSRLRLTKLPARGKQIAEPVSRIGIPLLIAAKVARLVLLEVLLMLPM